MNAQLDAKRDARRKMMLEMPVHKLIPLVAFPMIVTMLIDSFYNLADTYFVSRIGTAATAAVGVNGSLMHLLRSVALGFGMGASSYISRLLGAKEDQEACRVGATTFFTAVMTLSVIAAAALCFMSPLVTLLGATENVKPHSIQYARFILIAAPFTAGEVVLSQLLRSEGSTRYSMIGMVSGCCVNLALDPLLISAAGMGVAGAALATCISKAVSFGILLAPFLRQKTVLELKFRHFTPKLSIYREIARMGVPSFLRASMMTISTIITNNIAGTFSDSALAAVSVANKCTRLVGSAIMGFGQGFQPVAGFCWGAKRYDRVRGAFKFCTLAGVTISLALGLGMAALSEELVGLFAASGDREIVEIGALMIRLQCYTMTMHTWVMIACGLFQALGRAVSAGVLGLSRQVICLIPCVLLLSKFFGVRGLASAQAAADILSTLLALPMVLAMFRKIGRLERAAQPPNEAAQPPS